MPLFIDTHEKIDGLTPEAVAGAHAMDLATQDKYGANFLRYWFNESTGRVYCLVDAPSAQAAEQVHKEAHGLVADEIVQVSEGK
jgi:hypothetical protein